MIVYHINPLISSLDSHIKDTTDFLSKLSNSKKIVLLWNPTFTQAGSSFTANAVYLVFAQTVRIETGKLGLQWATKAVETLLGNDAFRYLSICSILFASSVNSLIPRPPNSMLCRRCGLCSRRNRKINIVLGGRGKCDQDAQKFNFITKCLNTFVAIEVLDLRMGESKKLVACYLNYTLLVMLHQLCMILNPRSLQVVYDKFHS